MTSKSAKQGLAVMFFILLIWVIAYPISRSIPTETFNDPFAHVYNSLNVLFTALAFGGVVVSLFLQSEQIESARREETERSVFELFMTYSGKDFQPVKDASFKVLLAAVKNRQYAEFVASRLFVVEQIKDLPLSVIPVYRELNRSATENEQIAGADAFAGGATTITKEMVAIERAERLMLDNMLNFFAMIAQRKSSADVIKHTDFDYDWWRPALWLIGQIQRERYEAFKQIEAYCKRPLVASTLRDLDKIYGHAALNTREEVWEYLLQHPKLNTFMLDEEFRNWRINKPTPTNIEWTTV